MGGLVNSHRFGGIPVFLRGNFPVWIGRAPYLTLSGSNVTTMLDASMGLYPLAQEVSSRRPVVNGDKVTFATNDYLYSTDATLCAMADNRSAWTLWAVAELNAPPSANEGLLAWGNSADLNSWIWGANDSSFNKLQTVHNTVGNPGLVHNSDAAMDGTRAAYLFQGTGGATTDTISSYKDNVLTATAVNGTAGATTHDRFAMGCLLRLSAGGFFNGSIVAAGAMNRVMTSNERAVLNQWRLDGCPA